MAFPAALNDQNNDLNPFSIDEENVGLAPAVAMGNLFMTTSSALGLATLNAAQQQQLDWQTSSACTVKSIDRMWAVKNNSPERIIVNL
jgi:hypothetical protein